MLPATPLVAHDAGNTCTYILFPRPLVYTAPVSEYNPKVASELRVSCPLRSSEQFSQVSQVSLSFLLLLLFPLLLLILVRLTLGAPESLSPSSGCFCSSHSPLRFCRAHRPCQVLPQQGATFRCSADLNPCPRCSPVYLLDLALLSS